MKATLKMDQLAELLNCQKMQIKILHKSLWNSLEQYIHISMAKYEFQ